MYANCDPINWVDIFIIGRYAIDSDKWEEIKGLLPPERKAQVGRPPKDHRKMLNAMPWIARLVAIPRYYGSWPTLYSRFRRWQIAGILDGILVHVSIEPDFENFMIDAPLSWAISMELAQEEDLKQAVGRSSGGLRIKIPTRWSTPFVLTGGQCY